MFILALAAGHTSAQTTCSNWNCQPGIKDNWPRQTWSVYIDQLLDTATRNTITTAINGWNAYFVNAGQPPVFRLTTMPPGDVHIVGDPFLAGSGNGAVNDGGRRIRLNPDYGNNSGFMRQVISHELGHTVGFTDTYDLNCRTSTIMYGIIDPNASSFLSGPTSCDRASLRIFYPPPATGHTDGGGTQITDGGNDGMGGGYSDPLVIDLNGDGIQTTGEAAPVSFDMYGEGVRQRLTWTNANTEEGFLWIDLDHDNRVTDGRELFGVGTVLPTGERARDGFEALSMYDTPSRGGNSDGAISADDAVWNRLRIWVDRNHNGLDDPGESNPIRRYNIALIPTGYVLAVAPDESGNIHALQGSYKRRVGGAGGAHDEYHALDAMVFRVVQP
jgi:hypothetical protein